jgi:hypothetical protein
VCLLALLRHRFLHMVVGDRGDVRILPAPAGTVMPQTGKDTHSPKSNKLKIAVNGWCIGE